MPRCLREIVGSDSSTSQPPPEPTVSGSSAIAIVSPRSGPLTTSSRPAAGLPDDGRPHPGPASPSFRSFPLREATTARRRAPPPCAAPPPWPPRPRSTLPAPPPRCASPSHPTRRRRPRRRSTSAGPRSRAAPSACTIDRRRVAPEVDRLGKAAAEAVAAAIRTRCGRRRRRHVQVRAVAGLEIAAGARQRRTPGGGAPRRRHAAESSARARAASCRTAATAAAGTAAPTVERAAASPTRTRAHLRPRR